MSNRGTGIVGSVNVELEKTYRVMLLKIANELTHDECQQVAFVAKLPSPTCIPEPGKTNVRLHLMSTLESLGHIGPLKLDFLEDTLDAVGRRNLLEIIDCYKKKALYREAKKRIEDQLKKKKNGKKLKFRNQSDPASECSSAAQELLAIKENTTEKMRKLKESYATLLTQFSQVALLMRSAIESEDLTQIEETFLSIARDGDAITRTLRRNLSAAGIKCGSDSCSSSDSPVHTPTEELQYVFETPASGREELSSHHQLQYRDTAETQEASSSPQRKKPIPLPRKKWPQLESCRAPSAPTSPATPNKFVSCHQETQSPSSTFTATAFHIPQSASTSCLTYSSDYSGDYSGGTGDSGVCDIRQKYVPSQKSLDDLDPSRQQKTSEHSQDQSSECGADERPRYMKLKTFEKTTSDGYVHPFRAQSMDDVLTSLDSSIRGLSLPMTIVFISM